MADRHAPYRGIKKLAPGLWQVRARAVDPRTGRDRAKTRRVECQTKAQAARARDELQEELNLELEAGTAGRDARPRLVDYASEWLELRAGVTAPSTQQRELAEVAEIVTELGDYYVDAVRPADVERWRNAQLREGRSPHTVNSRLRTLRAIYRSAQRDLEVGDPTVGVASARARRTQGRRARWLTADEFARFVAAAAELGRAKRAWGSAWLSPDIARMILALAWTGMRRGELLALEWRDDLGGELALERAVWRHEVGSTKTDDPRRVPVVEPLREVLGEQRRWLMREQHPGLESGLVFPAQAHRRAQGKTWHRSGSCLDKPLRKVCAAAGLEELSAHALRRTWEQLLREARVEDLVRRSMAGWRSKEAQAIYAETTEAERAAAGAAVVRLVGGSSGNSSGNLG